MVSQLVYSFIVILGDQLLTLVIYSAVQINVVVVVVHSEVNFFAVACDIEDISLLNI